MGKQQTTILAAIETTTAPPVHDFLVSGIHASLILQVFTLAGTAPTIAVTATELFDKGFTLAYDAQTTNFTVGRTVKGKFSNATGLIMDDTDAGLTGTLELKKVTGHFVDNEPLEELGFVNPGKATANGTLTRVLAPGAVWCSIAAGSVDAIATFINPEAAVVDKSRVIPRRFRLTVTEGGVWSAARFTVDLVQHHSGG